MGEPVSVIQTAALGGNRLRFETNRSLTGMGHERYSVDEEVFGDRPPDRIARAMFDTGQVQKVHVYTQTITVTLKPGANGDGLKELVEDMYIFYKPGVPVPKPEDFA